MKKVDALPASTFSAFLLLLYPCRHVGGSGQLQPLHSAQGLQLRRVVGDEQHRPSGAPAAELRPTMPPKAVPVAEGGRTVGVMQSQMGFDPVVGWLACVAGPSRGKSYTIRGGINSIGRSDRMDITITGDMKLSAENHAKLSYSERNNRFNLIPGDGRNIIYLNGEEVFAPVPLKAYDLIDFGETKLLFVPLCGEHFTWKQEEDSHGTDQ